MGEVISYTKDGVDQNLANAIYGIGTDGNILLLTKGDGSVIQVPIGLGSVVGAGVDGNVITLTKGDGSIITVTTENAIGAVNHGTDPDVPRPPGYARVEWTGTVEPLNATEDDKWINA